MCAEGASLPLRGADAEMKRPGDHYTFGPIVSGARPRKGRNESTPTYQHTGKGPCEQMNRNPRHLTVKKKRKEEEKEQEGKKNRAKKTKNTVPLGRLNAAKDPTTTKQTVRERTVPYGRTTTCTCGCHHSTEEEKEL